MVIDEPQFPAGMEIGLATNRIDFYRILTHTTDYFNFDNFAVLDLHGHVFDGSGLDSMVVLDNWPKDLAKDFDARFLISEDPLFIDLLKSTTPKAWIMPSGETSDSHRGASTMLREFGYDLAVTVPLASTSSRRYAVLLFGDRVFPYLPELARISLEFARIFERMQQTILSAEKDTALTPRELEIVTMIAEGKTSASIASNLGLSEHTVNSHTVAAMKKLESCNRAHLVARAIRMGLVR